VRPSPLAVTRVGVNWRYYRRGPEPPQALLLRRRLIELSQTGCCINTSPRVEIELWKETL
jgi:hypothetical protein